MFTKVQWALLIATLGTVAIFAVHYVRELNYEFIAYTISIVGIFAALYGTLRVTKFPTYLIVGIAIWAVLHMMGGSVQTSDGVLYAYKIYPFFDGGNDFYVLKMDQLIHAFLYGVVALMFFHLLRNVVGIKTHRAFIAFTAVFASAGLGIINEIIEFSAVVALPETGVGGYENTVLDLIFNLSGAAVAVIGYLVVNKIYGKES